MEMVKINLILQVPYEDDRTFLSDKVAMLLREIADFSEKSVRKTSFENPAGVTKVLQSGTFSWEPFERRSVEKK